MRRHFLALLTGALIVVLSIGVGVSIAGTTQASDNDPAVGGSDNLSHPLGDKQEALRQAALEKVAKGEIPKGTKVGKLAKGQYVELAREGEDSILTVLGEFGSSINPTYGGRAGPAHNQIPQPDRATDNTTIWAPDFSQSYHTSLLFNDSAGANSMRSYYKEQSSNRYTVNGDVTDWVTVPFNEANYGANYCGGIVCARTWLFVRDSLTAWYNAQLASGKTAAQVDEYLKKFDVWDRYDYDGDGNFDEPDGYIYHFQSIHAGDGEETGGGAQGTNAIWCHRWSAFYTTSASRARASTSSAASRSATRATGSSTTLSSPRTAASACSRTSSPTTSGLPDEYDTSGNTGGAENARASGRLMSQAPTATTVWPPRDRQPAVPHERVGQAPARLARTTSQLKPGDTKASLKLGPSDYNDQAGSGRDRRAPR